ncbi:MAG: THUMP domain-containing protein [Flavobacteriales bacterium]|jgi:putative N6-adenine-specific DNA methylase|nr:THUMP domain-containing protein [Flavobacteriales bacterium]
MMQNDNLNIVVRTFSGLEQVLSEELKRIGGRDVKIKNRAVSCKGDIGFVYKANFRLRTAIDVLVEIDYFRFYNEDDYYNNINNINWEHHISIAKSFVVKAVAFNSHTFNNTHYLELKTKDGIVDRFKEVYNGERPNVDAKRPDVPVFVHVEETRATVYLNSSGQPLFKRGYRTEKHQAPINEVLASGLLKLAGWPKEKDFYDPMCGSGTFLIEAIFHAQDIPGGIIRRNWAFMHWRGFDKALWQKIKEVSIDKITYFGHQFYGADKQGKCLAMTKKHLENVKLDDVVSLQKSDFLEEQKPLQNCFIMSNPPYNMRIKSELMELYSGIGNCLKQNYSGSEAWFIAPRHELSKKIGLKPKKKYGRIFQGKIECELIGVEMYQGSKKFKKQR